jgi:hypothetical protein
MIRRVARLLLLVVIVLNASAAVWTLAQNPFARPFVARSADELRLAIDRALARSATPDLVRGRLIEALDAGDIDRVEIYAGLADDHAIGLDPATAARIAELRARQVGFWNGVRACGSCAWDIASCRSIAMMGACGLTVEVSPLGDLNALRRAAVAWTLGENVDELDASLAVIGLAATGLIVVSGGSSGTVKVGAGLIRSGRRVGAVGVKLAESLALATKGLIRWSHVPNAVWTRNFDEAVDAVRLGRLTAMTADFGIVAERTGTAEAVWLLRHVDNGEDLARLARVSEAMGKDSRKALDVLGKPRTFRLLHRVADMAVLAVGLVALVASQILSLLLGLVLRMLRRLARPRHPARRRAAAAGPVNALAAGARFRQYPAPGDP